MSIVVRALGTSGLGTYVVAITFGGFLMLLTDAGTGLRLSRVAGVLQGGIDEEFRRSMGLRVVLSGAAVILFGLYLALRQESHWLFLASVGVSFVLMSYAYGIECFARARGLVWVEALSTTSGSIGTFVGLYLVVQIAEPSLELFGGVLLLSAVIRILALWLLCPAEVAAVPRFLRLRALLASASPYGASALLQLAFTQIDVLLIGWVAGSVVAGEYALPSRVVVAVGLTMAYGANAMVTSVAARSLDPDRMRVLWKQLAAGGFVFGASIGLALWILTDVILVALYGAVVPDGVREIWPWLCLFVPVAVCNAFLAAFLTGSGHQYVRVAASSLGLCAVVFGCLTLVPAFGLSGGAFQLLIAEACVLLTYLAFLHRFRPRV